MNAVVTSKEQLRDLWVDLYGSDGRPDWSRLLPYYHPQIRFRDTVQGIRGIGKFTAMTERLSRRSGHLKMTVHHVAQTDNVFFLEWTLTLRFNNLPESAICGTSRVVLEPGGKIAEQRDYYDLWGDIFDHIPGWGRLYRLILFRLFG